MNHTPGPWQVGFRDGSGRNYITDSAGRVVVRGDHCAAAGVIKRADAKLIAAAPELLEALVALERLLSPLAYDSTQKDWLNRARAAITKATGK